MPDMPDMPDLPSFDLSMPDMFKRKKEPRPKRYHPPTKAKRFFKFRARDIDTKVGNALIEEVAWCVYAAWNAHTRRDNPPPFYLKEYAEFDKTTQIEDFRPKIEEDEKKEE
jgi:hypothetical protein